MARTKVQSELIATNAISGTIIADGAITSTHLAANCVDSSELVTGSIDTIHIAANQVTATKIVTNGVLTRHISDDQVTAAKLANSINTDIATGVAALPKAGGTLTGALTGTSAAFNSGTTNIVATFTSTDSLGGIQLADNSGNVELVANANNFEVRNAGGSATMVVENGGKVGIGTTPTAGKLDIVGGASGVSVRVRGDVGAGAYYYGYMFDGTDVRGTTQTNIFYSGSAIAANTTIAEYAGIRIDQPNTSASGAVVTNNYAIYSSGSAQKSYFAGKVGIGRADPTQLLEVHKAAGGDQTVAKFSAHNYGDTGKTFIEIGGEYGDGSSRIGSFNDTGNKSVLVFDTHDAGSGAFAERMRIDSAGKVGIGETTPDDTLHVNASGGTARLRIGSGNDAYYTKKGYLGDEWVFGSGETGDIVDFTVSGGNFSGSSGGYRWKIANSGGTPASKMRLTSGGKLGLGTDTPRYDFTVSGTNTTAIGIGVDNASGGSTLDIAALGSGYTSHQAAAGEVWLYSPDNINIGGATGNQNDIKFLANNVVSMIIRGNSNRVGIGTTNPGAKLEISGKDDEGATDLLRLIFDNSPADTGITFADINSTIKNRISMDSSNTNDLYISSGTDIKFSVDTTTVSSTKVVHLNGVSSSISTAHMGFGAGGPSADITIQCQGHGIKWRFGSHISASHSYWINTNNAGVYMVSGNTSWSAHSDERLKENITPLGDVLPNLLNMRCVKYNRKGDSGNTKIGFIAQDWEGKGFDEVVDEDMGFTIQNNGLLKSVEDSDNSSTTKPKSIAYTETIPVLLKAIQELEARIATLEG